MEFEKSLKALLKEMKYLHWRASMFFLMNGMIGSQEWSKQSQSVMMSYFFFDIFQHCVENRKQGNLFLSPES